MDDKWLGFGYTRYAGNSKLIKRIFDNELATMVYDILREELNKIFKEHEKHISAIMNRSTVDWLALNDHEITERLEALLDKDAAGLINNLYDTPNPVAFDQSLRFFLHLFDRPLNPDDNAIFSLASHKRYEVITAVQDFLRTIEDYPTKAIGLLEKIAIDKADPEDITQVLSELKDKVDNFIKTFKEI